MPHKAAAGDTTVKVDATGCQAVYLGQTKLAAVHAANCASSLRYSRRTPRRVGLSSTPSKQAVIPELKLNALLANTGQAGRYCNGA